MKKKIIGITGCRSEYDIIYPVMREMQKDGNFVQLTYVNYKQQEFLHLLDIMDYSYAQIINNKRVSIDM